MDDNNQLPKEISSGLEAYQNGGSDKAVYKWMLNSIGPNWDHKMQYVHALNKTEGRLGAYTGYEFLKKVDIITDFKTVDPNGNPISQRSGKTGDAYLVKLQYEKGSIVMGFNFDLSGKMFGFEFEHDLSQRPGGGPNGEHKPEQTNPGTSQDSAQEGIVAEGFMAYSTNGATAAVGVWLKGSSDKQAISDTQSILNETESSYGKYLSNQPIPFFSGSDSSAGHPPRVQYVIAYYERHELYMAFTLEADHIIQSIQCDTDASRVFTNPDLVRRAELEASNYYRKAGIIRGL